MSKRRLVICAGCLREVVLTERGIPRHLVRNTQDRTRGKKGERCSSNTYWEVGRVPTWAR